MLRCAFCNRVVTLPCGSEHDMRTVGDPLCISAHEAKPLGFDPILHSITEWAKERVRHIGHSHEVRHDHGGFGVTVCGGARNVTVRGGLWR